MPDISWNGINCDNKCDLKSCDLSKVQDADYIYLNRCKLKEIPEELSMATNLKKLDLEFTRIKEIKNVPNSVTWLDISNNKLDNLDNIPPNIETLFINGNNIKQINPGDLPSTLRFLNIRSNKIDMINNLPNGLKQLNMGFQGGKKARKEYFLRGIRTDAVLPDGIEALIVDGDFCKMYFRGRNKDTDNRKIIDRLRKQGTLTCNYARPLPK